MTEAETVLAAAEPAVKFTEKDIAVFWSHVTKSDGCWEWTGCFFKKSGYGRICMQYVRYVAHRLSYLINIGPIPDGMMVCHKCDNRKCVRPDHFFLGSHIDNMADMKIKGRAASGERNAMLLYRGMFLGSKNPRAVITETDVPAIRSAIKAGVRRAELAARYGVAKVTIDALASGRNWSHVP